MNKLFTVATLLGLCVTVTAFATEKTSAEAKEVHAAKLVNCVNAKLANTSANTNLDCNKFKSLDKTVKDYQAGKKSRSLTGAIKKLEHVDINKFTEPDKTLITTARASKVYQESVTG